MSSNQLQSDYRKRINKVFQFIDDNLDGDLSLHQLAGIAHFSPYHFHRIFKYITKEPLNKFVIRRRIEQSALDLLHKKNDITELSFKYGFSDNSSYSKAFKKHYGVSPTYFKQQNEKRYFKIDQLKSKIGQAEAKRHKYLCLIDELKNWIAMNDKQITVKEMPQMHLGYITILGPQNLGEAYQKIMKWAAPKGLMNDQTKMVTVYFDSFKVTPPEKVRMNASILLEEKIELQDEVDMTTIEPGRCIVGSFEIGMREYEKYWTGLFMWMNENGYKKADANPFEIYHNNPMEHPQGLAKVDLCIPVD